MAVIFDSNHNPDENSIRQDTENNPVPANIINDTNENSKEKGVCSENFKELLEIFKDYFEKERAGVDVAPIHVDEIASKVALFYENIRKIVDWKEEHLVRRGAIERVLKRKMLSKISGITLSSDFQPDKIAEPLVLELIRGGHFPNDKIPQEKIMDVQKVLRKYTFILGNNPIAKNTSAAPKIKKQINFYNWILEIAACEIEETIEPPVRQRALTEFMVKSMNKRIKLTPLNLLDEKEKETQIFVAVLRTLFSLDKPIISYYLLKIIYPQWKNPTDDFLINASENIFVIEDEINKSLNHSFESQFYNLCEKYDTIYLLLGDVLNSFKNKPSRILRTLESPKKLSSLVKIAYNKRLSTLKKRLTRAAIFSTLSVFVSGGVSLFIFEVPIAKLFYGTWKPLSILVDILLPTMFMAALVSIVRPPKKSNLERVLKETKKIVYPKKDIDVYEIKPKGKRGFIINTIIGFFYLLATFISLALIFFVFELGEIPLTSLYIDTLNVAVIVFAALVIRQRAKELTVEEKVSFWDFIIDILAIPVAEIGQWLANKWKEYNIVSVFFIALIDMPFSSFIHFIENWRSFLKERKSEIH